MADVREYLQRKGFEYTVRGDQAVLNCPLCGDTEKKFAISLTTGAWNCLHLSRCGKKGSLRSLQVELGDVPRWTEGLKPRMQYRPKRYVQPVPVEGALSERAIAWLKGRGLTEETIRRFKLTQKDGAIVFPFLKNGKIVNQKYRTADKDFWQEKEAEPVLFNRDAIWPELRELIIVEGEIDCMTLVQLGIENAVSVPSGAGNLDWIENEFTWLERFDTIYLGLDNDQAGDEGAEKIASRLGRWRCMRVYWPEKDANDCLKAGLGREQFDDCILQAEDMGPPIVKTAEDFFDSLLIQEREGIKIGFPTFDGILGGFRDGEVTVWTGRNGDGKTTLLGQMVTTFLAKDIKCCIASLEMRPKWLLRWMLFQCGYSASPEGVRRFGDITRGRLTLLDTQEEVNPDTLMDSFEYVARKIGARVYVIDSLLRISLGGGPDWLERQRQFMNRLTQFAMKYECHVHLVAHPRKGTTDGDRIDKVDIAGSGDISNLAFNVVSLRRIEKEAGDSGPAAVIEVMKNRETGKLGAVLLAFDEGRKVFAEHKTLWPEVQESFSREETAKT
jgi:twinkle protein